MSAKRRSFNALADGLIALLQLNRPIRAYRALLSRVNAVKRVEIDGTRMVFDANEELHLLRAELLATKEPETIAWIDSFALGAVFYDIGANVGVFSVYAALRRNCDVYAFEPEAKNYACLNKNLLLNDLGRRVKALNVGLDETTRIDFLQLHDLGSGAALHALGEPVDWRGRTFTPKFEQAVLAFGLDELVERFGMPVPAHVKLDVDGGEARIVRGATRTLADPRMRSLMVELDENDSALFSAIEACGLALAGKTLLAMQGGTRDMYNAVFVRT